MEERQMDIAVPVEKLNAILGCKLCNGYFRNAHTIVECLHTFCRECLEENLEKANYGKKLCPTCKLNLGIVIKKISYQYNIKSPSPSEQDPIQNIFLIELFSKLLIKSSRISLKKTVQ